MSAARFWGGIFLLAAGLNILAGGHAWLAVFAGHAADPETALRLLRLRQGIGLGHLVNTVRAPATAPPVLTPWSRLLDIVLWVLAAPLAPLLGWSRALAAAALVLPPLSVGSLGLAVAFAARPLAEDRLLWTAAVAAALLPGLVHFAGPGMVRDQILAAALLAGAAGCLLRASRSGGTGQAFFGGGLGGFAVWLTPVALPFYLFGCAGLLWRWARPGQAVRFGGAILAGAAGFIDPLGFGFAIDPPQGGYLVAATGRLSIITVTLALLLLIGAQAVQRLPNWRHFGRHGGLVGLGIMAGAVLLWVLLFPKILAAPAGLPRGGFEPWHSTGQAAAVLLPGVIALGVCVWRAIATAGSWAWIYGALGSLAALLLAARAAPFAPFPSVIAAALLPMALGAMRRQARPDFI